VPSTTAGNVESSWGEPGMVSKASSVHSSLEDTLEDTLDDTLEDTLEDNLENTLENTTVGERRRSVS